VKKLGIRIDSILPEKNLQISDEMPEYVEDPDKPCNTDDDFLANRRLIESNEWTFGQLLLGSRGKGRDRHIARLLVNLRESIATVLHCMPHVTKHVLEPVQSPAPAQIRSFLLQVSC
jgi:hypothetical protein